MKNLILLNVFILTIFVINYNYSQPVPGQALASKVLYYDGSGLIGQSAEILGPISDSTSRGGSEGRNELVCFEGVFYHVASSQKYESGVEKNLFRKSNDGINWTSSVRAGDAPSGVTEYATNIYVWRKNSNIHVGISYVDTRDTYDQMRFVLSTDGGATFQPSIQIGNNTIEHDILHNCGFAGIGDTIVVSWTYRIPPPFYYAGPTYYTITTDGGASWLPMGISHSGGIGSYTSDVMIAPDRTIFIATCHSVGSPRNIEVRSTTNLGANWITETNITAETGNNSNDILHLTKFNDNFYAAWFHDFLTTPYVDRLYFSKSTDSGENWQPRIRINDPDTIAIWSNGGRIGGIGHPKLAFSPSGTIYAVWADSRERHNLSYDSAWFHVYISRSTDNGDTWSTDLKVSEPSDVSKISNWYPSVEIKSDGVIDTLLLTWTKIRNVEPAVEGICEYFSPSSFPPTGWSLDFTGTQYWTRNAVSAYGVGSGSAKFDFWFALAGTDQSLISTELSPTVATDTLMFDIAYAGYNMPGNTDSLIIETSSNSGATYSRLVALWGNSSGGPLNTTPPIGTEYNPNFEHWAKRKYALPVSTNKIKFRAKSGYGNNLYLDNVCIISNNSFTLYNVKVIPEGFYNSGTERLNIKDTVKAYLRNIITPFTLVDSSIAVVDSVTYNSNFVFQNANTGTYYIFIKHRNTIETWSKSGGETFTKGGTLSYDFTTAANQAFGNNMKLADSSPVRYAIFSGDIDQNRLIDLSDILLAYNASSSFTTGYNTTDVTGDNISDLSDIIITYNNSCSFVTAINP